MSPFASGDGARRATDPRPALWRLDRKPLPYRDGVKTQRELVARRQRDEIPDVLLLTEHPPVYTLGTVADPRHLLLAPERMGAEVCETDRGGDVTFHGPGQLVAYPILDLRHWRKDVRAYLRALEQAVIEAVSGYGVAAGRRPGCTGVWCGGAEADSRKLAAIGVRVARWVTSHGVAVNVGCDLRWFDRIVPCGISGCRITSLEAETGRRPSLDRFTDRLAASIARVFGRRLLPAPEGALPDV